MKIFYFILSALCSIAVYGQADTTVINSFDDIKSDNYYKIVLDSNCIWVGAILNGERDGLWNVRWVEDSLNFSAKVYYENERLKRFSLYINDNLATRIISGSPYCIEFQYSSNGRLEKEIFYPASDTLPTFDNCFEGMPKVEFIKYYSYVGDRKNILIESFSGMIGNDGFKRIFLIRKNGNQKYIASIDLDDRNLVLKGMSKNRAERILKRAGITDYSFSKTNADN